MAKILTIKSFLTKIYNYQLNNVFPYKNITFLPSNKIYFTFMHNGNNTYTRIADPSKGGYRICIGGETIRKAIEAPDHFYDLKTVKKFVPGANMAFQGLYYHEIGHILYTDMVCDHIINYRHKSGKDYRNFIHSIFNITEDIVIEKFCMSVDYPYTAKYFKFLTNQMFVPMTKYYKDVTNSPESFMNYLLLKLRLGSKFTGSNTIFDLNKKEISSRISYILTEPNPTKRIDRCIKLAEWLIDNTPLDFSLLPEVQETSGSLNPSKTGANSGSATGVTPSNTPSKKTEVREGGNSDDVNGESQDDGSSRNTSYGPGSSNQNRTADTSSSVQEKPEIKTKDELDNMLNDDNDVENHYDPDNDLLIENCPEIDDAFNETLGISDNHEFVIAKNSYLYGNNTIKALNERISDIADLSFKVAKSLGVYKGRIKPKNTPGFNSGKLNIRRAMTNHLTGGCDTKLFKRKVSNGNAPDLAISILCDNSGSMGGNKSHVCTTAMLALAKACDYCNIPLEVSCFTESWSSGCYTIRMKDFKDSFDQALPYLGITDQDICRTYKCDERIPTFAGNKDEVNLYYVYQEFKRNKHKDKVIIVISDGETCGSSQQLRDLISLIEKDGIHVIGLGIQSRAVSTIYKEHYLFDTQESLDKLPTFLTELFLKLAKGGK